MFVETLRTTQCCTGNMLEKVSLIKDLENMASNK